MFGMATNNDHDGGRHKGVFFDHDKIIYISIRDRRSNEKSDNITALQTIT